jgi:hypothetical protein
MVDESLDCIVDKDGKFVLWRANVMRAICEGAETWPNVDQEELERQINKHLQERCGRKDGPFRLCAFADSKPSAT